MYMYHSVHNTMVRGFRAHMRMSVRTPPLLEHSVFAFHSTLGSWKMFVTLP